jgi:uncharacterized protein YbjT (DUF2867 family)
METRDRLILVTGATGKQGGSVAWHLLDAEYPVRVLVRDPSKHAARTLADRGAEIAVGDFDDSDSLDSAMQGVHGVFSVQNWLPDGPEVERRRGIAVAEAAARAGVEHFTYSSVGGAERNTGIPHFESKWLIEQRIRDLDLPATIWRPAYFMENLLVQRNRILAGHLIPPLDPSVPVQFIAVDDIGGFVALGFQDPDRWIGEATEIAGDELSYDEIAEALARVLARPMVLERPSPPDRPERRQMLEWFREAGYCADIPALRSVLPQLHDFTAWAEFAFAPARSAALGE